MGEDLELQKFSQNMINKLPKHIIFILHGQTENVIIDELFKPFLEFLYEKNVLESYYGNDDHPIIHIGKDFDFNCYHSFNNVREKLSKTLLATIRRVKNDNIKINEVVVFFILDYDKGDTKENFDYVVKNNLKNEMEEIFKKEEVSFNDSKVFY